MMHTFRTRPAPNATSALALPPRVSTTWLTCSRRRCAGSKLKTNPGRASAAPRYSRGRAFGLIAYGLDTASFGSWTAKVTRSLAGSSSLWCPSHSAETFPPRLASLVTSAARWFYVQHAQVSIELYRLAAAREHRRAYPVDNVEAPPPGVLVFLPAWLMGWVWFLVLHGGRDIQEMSRLLAPQLLFSPPVPGLGMRDPDSRGIKGRAEQALC